MNIYGELSGLAPADELKGPTEDYEKINTVIKTTLANPLFSADLLARIPTGYPEQLATVLRALEAHVGQTQVGTIYADDILTITQFPID